MLNLYYGNGRVDKEKYIFDSIKGKAFLVVPDQFSLQAERDAFFYLEKKGLMDLRIVDFSGLGSKVLRQVGGSRPPLIDKYGRHMLIAKIIEDKNKKGQLTVYRGLSWKNTFIDMMSRLISEMKRYENTPEDIKTAADDLGEQGFLKGKLTDIAEIYSSYREAIAGKYLDSEDYITFYGTKLMNAPMIEEADIWIYGFDSFDPINKSIIERLLKTAKSVNIVMTLEEGREEFNFTKRVISDLKSLAEGCGEEVFAEEIKGSFRDNVWDRKRAGEDSIKLALTSNPYAEAERAAAYILHLIRDEDYKYADIAVICNDMEGRGNALRRILLRWNIPVFMDRRRKVLHHSAVGFLIALMEVISGGYSNGAIMTMIKSGLIDGPLDQLEIMENYAKQYRIKGTKWREPFSRGADLYGQEELASLDRLRSYIVQLIETAREGLGSRNTVESKVKGIYEFLDRSFNMSSRLEAMIKQQEQDGFAENAAETAQSWNVICNILDQLVETLGEETISNRELTLLMKAGFESVEIGLVPTTSDSILIGSLNRAMVSRKKAVVIIGANQGILPKESGFDGLLNEYEKEELENRSLKLSKSQSAEVIEDRLALYRSLFVPDRELYISCSRTGDTGEALSKSQLFEMVADALSIKPYDDLAKEETVTDKLTTKEGSLGYMAGAFRDFIDGAALDEDWLTLRSWYERNEPAMLKRMERGISFSNNIERLGDSFADALYRGDKEDLEVSASRLEKYSSCPFAHFMNYGLRPEELRAFEIGAAELGDVYHRCLMLLSKKLTVDIDVSDAVSPWMTITREECRQEIVDIIEGSLGDYKEGLLFSGETENYRRQRLADICYRAAWQLIEQVRKGNIKSMLFEEPFGKGCKLPPVEIELTDKFGEGDAIPRRVLIRGVIDRLDILNFQDLQDTEAVRIIDYKTGNNKIAKEHFEEGYRLQLMVYMAAAMSAGRDGSEDVGEPDSLKPAGMFYFKIKDLNTDAGTGQTSSLNTEEDLKKRLETAYRLEGIVVDDAAAVAAMDSDITDKSTVLPIKRDKEGALKATAGGTLLTTEEFEQLRLQVDEQVNRICHEIYDGRIDISPARERESGLHGQITACTYCSYKSICLFDTSFMGCRYRDV